MLVSCIYLVLKNLLQPNVTFSMNIDFLFTSFWMYWLGVQQGQS